MNGKAFLDTNILVYAVDPTDAPKQATAQRLLDQAFGTRDTAISTQVLLEFVAVATRKTASPMTLAEARTHVRDLSRLEVVEIDTAMILDGSELAERYRLSIWDAMIVAAATRARCATLWTEDLSDGQTFGDLTVRDPFGRL